MEEGIKRPMLSTLTAALERQGERERHPRYMLFKRFFKLLVRFSSHATQKQQYDAPAICLTVLFMLTCPKKATRKYVPSSLLPVCITSITLV